MTNEDRQTVIQALEAVDALIDHQFTGTSRGMTALQHACDDCREALTIMRREPTTKLWLWKNFVDDRPEYWAFDNPFPVHLDCGDPQTLGEPCGYAIVKPSRVGRTDVTEEQVLRRIKQAKD